VSWEPEEHSEPEKEVEVEGFFNDSASPPDMLGCSVQIAENTWVHQAQKIEHRLQQEWKQ